jgi:hypothetical protein
MLKLTQLLLLPQLVSFGANIRAPGHFTVCGWHANTPSTEPPNPIIESPGASFRVSIRIGISAVFSLLLP